MSKQKNVERAIKTVEKFLDENSKGKFYLYINWTNACITIHGEESTAVKKQGPPDKERTVFGIESNNGFWFGYFNSYLEAVGYSKLINDTHHIQASGYFVISNSWGVNWSEFYPF